MCSYSWWRSARLAGTVALATTIALVPTVCGEATSPVPVVHATVVAPRAAGGVEAITLGGKRDFLANGTKVTAECVSSGDPFTVEASIDSGASTGATAQLPRAGLFPHGTVGTVEAPYGGQDPFGILDHC